MSKSERLARISLRDVAYHAGVSVGTASNVFTGKAWVSPETRTLVLEVAAELGYVPRARTENNSISEKALTVGFIVRNTPIPLMTNPYYAPILTGAEKVCADQGISLMYAVADEQITELDDFPMMIQRREIQGLLVIDYFRPAFFDTLQQTGIPFVLIEHEVEQLVDTDTICIDDERGGYLATLYLLQKGHCDPPPAIIAGPNNYLSVQRRLAGYYRALREYNLEPPDEYIRIGDLNLSAGQHEMNAMLQLAVPPTAVFCCNDITAIGAMNALKEHGIQIPEQCSLIGYDDIEMASQVNPPLTTIKSETEMLGVQGVWHLLERLRTPQLAPRRTLLQVRCIERRSVQEKKSIAADTDELTIISHEMTS